MHHTNDRQGRAGIGMSARFFTSSSERSHDDARATISAVSLLPVLVACRPYPTRCVRFWGALGADRRSRIVERHRVLTDALSANL
jgi:hypothetical protein